MPAIVEYGDGVENPFDIPWNWVIGIDAEEGTDCIFLSDSQGRGGGTYVCLALLKTFESGTCVDFDREWVLTVAMGELLGAD